jgi:integrase
MDTQENDLHKLFEQYVDGCHYTARLRPDTIRGYRAVFALFLKVMPEVTNTNCLAPEMLREFFKRIENRVRPVGKTFKKGVKNSTIRTQYAKLNVFFQWLYIKGFINQNPLAGIKPPQVRYDDFKRLKDEEVARIYAAIVQYSITPFMLRRDTLIVSILLFCGIRKGELAGLRVGDIDVASNQITIRAETSKSKRTKTLKMHPTLVMHMKDYLKERKALNFKTECLITSIKSDTGLTPHGFKHWTTRLIKNSGVRFHLHQFRHTFATKLAEANVQVIKIQKLLGHADISMTMRYLRSVEPENMEEDIRKLSF